MTQHKFYDTSSLLLLGDSILEDPTIRVIISDITLRELEEIKTSMRKSEEIKTCARRLTRALDEHFGNYTVMHYAPCMEDLIDRWHVAPNNDAKILACYCTYRGTNTEDCILYTNDICLKNLARDILPDACIQSVELPAAQDYTGYKECYLTEQETEYFYSNLTENSLNLLPNQYALLYDADSRILFDKVCWTGEDNRALTYTHLNSQYFGKTKPYNGDPYQALVLDSFKNNKITMVKGPAGTGKSWLSLSYLFHLLEHRQIDKIIIFCNTVATKDSAKLGLIIG